MEVIRKTIENKGIFYCLYVDKASHFKTTRYGGLHVNIDSEQDQTQIERALEELDINLILEICLKQREELKDYLALFRID